MLSSGNPVDTTWLSSTRLFTRDSSSIAHAQYCAPLILESNLVPRTWELEWECDWWHALTALMNNRLCRPAFFSHVNWYKALKKKFNFHSTLPNGKHFLSTNCLKTDKLSTRPQTNSKLRVITKNYELICHVAITHIYKINAFKPVSHKQSDHWPWHNQEPTQQIE